MTAYDGYALLFDCDGVIVETEEMHRVAYNAAFARFGLRIPSSGEEVVWSKSYYDILQNTVGGGKPKMKHHFNNVAKEWPKPNDREVPSTDEEKTALVDDLQDAKVVCTRTDVGYARHHDLFPSVLDNSQGLLPVRRLDEIFDSIERAHDTISPVREF